jgi:hypothetical protein
MLFLAFDRRRDVVNVRRICSGSDSLDASRKERVRTSYVRPDGLSSFVANSERPLQERRTYSVSGKFHLPSILNFNVAYVLVQTVHRVEYGVLLTGTVPYQYLPTPTWYVPGTGRRLEATYCRLGVHADRPYVSEQHTPTEYVRPSTVSNGI